MAEPNQPPVRPTGPPVGAPPPPPPPVNVGRPPGPPVAPPGNGGYGGNVGGPGGNGGNGGATPPTGGNGGGGVPPGNGGLPPGDGGQPPDGPVPPSGLPAPGAHGSGAAPTPQARKKLPLWDRVKFLLLIALLFAFFVWSAAADPNPFNTFGDAVDETVQSKRFLFVLFGIEAVRQLHYLISERSARYHRFWSDGVFGRIERRAGRLNDWNRYRLARATKLVIGIIVVSLVLGSLYDVAPVTALVELPSRMWEWLPMIFRLAFGFFFVIIQFVGLFWFLSRGGVDTYMPDEVKTRFSDVWGQDHVVDRVKENMVFLERPEAIEEKGGYVPGGILLWGPPGTGKTLMAEAVAGETGKPFVFVDPGAFIQMFMGVGILKVKGLFRKLRKLAIRYGGVIVFFDEADSLGSRGATAGPGQFATPAGLDTSPWSEVGGEHLRWLSPASQRDVLRSSLQPSEAPEPTRRWRDGIVMGGFGGGGGTLQALLSEMSGLKKPRGFLNRFGRRLLGMQPKPPPKYRILVMMATNMPTSLDPAMLRPGRIDRQYRVGYPSKEGRKRTYEGYLAKVRHELTDAEIEKLATITPYGTGASMKDLVNEALITAIRDGREVITWEDVIRAKHLKELGPPEDVEYIERERHAVAVHEACHAVAAYRKRAHAVIDLATIEKGSTYLGMVASIDPEDQFTDWRSHKEADITVCLASLAGERLFFDSDSSSGVSGDLRQATTMAALMEGYWGMGQTIASHAVSKSLGTGGGGPGGGPGGDDEDDFEQRVLKGSLGQRIEDNLRRLFDEAEALLTEHRADVLRVAHCLETHKTIAGEDLIAVIEGVQGPLIDGRVYHAPGFVDSLERYHEMVVAAHKRSGKVTEPLPPTQVGAGYGQPAGALGVGSYAVPPVPPATDT
ncbi:MAG TPA: AAA family ATPase [Acidimicrobiales bacterium]|nr:AAA family ATPase [Acidimicrobiales bacterium]